jgi:hypothetical protein
MNNYIVAYIYGCMFASISSMMKAKKENRKLRDSCETMLETILLYLMNKFSFARCKPTCIITELPHFK